MRAVEITRHPTVAERAELIAYVEEVAALVGERPLSDHLWLGLTGGDSKGFVAVRAAEADRTLALAQISAANDSSSLEVVVRPGLADEAAVGSDVASTAIDAFRSTGGGPLFWWVDDPTGGDRAFAAEHGLEPGRALYEMRRLMPAEQHAAVETRSFRPGTDEAAWLAVNNRAFADHPEQGGWTLDTLRARMGEPWFDPDGFRLHEVDGRLAAFCWTKLHTEREPKLGEIYVIAVDPDFHGQGLGKQLTLAGLDWIAGQGMATADLYVDAANTAAVNLYERLGFTVHRTRQAFAGVLTSHD